MYVCVSVGVCCVWSMVYSLSATIDTSVTEDIHFIQICFILSSCFMTLHMQSSGNTRWEKNASLSRSHHTVSSMYGTVRYLYT